VPVAVLDAEVEQAGEDTLVGVDRDGEPVREGLGGVLGAGRYVRVAGLFPEHVDAAAVDVVHPHAAGLVPVDARDVEPHLLPDHPRGLRRPRWGAVRGVAGWGQSAW
jgi:hypothetical protein